MIVDSVSDSLVVPPSPSFPLLLSPMFVSFHSSSEPYQSKFIFSEHSAHPLMI